MVFLHLEVGDTVTQQAANSVVLLKNGDAVTRTRQLLCRSHSSRATANNGNRFTRLGGWHLRCHPAFGPSPVNDGVLNRLDANRVLVHIERTCSLAGCGANTACELREVIGAVQHLNRIFPVALENQVVEIRNDVIHGTTAVTEGRTAIHAARRLLLGTRIIQTNDEFFVVLQALGGGQVALF